MVNASAMGVVPGELLMNANGEIQLISTSGEVYSNTSFPAGSFVELTEHGNVRVRDSSWNIVYQTGKYVSCSWPAEYSAADSTCKCPNNFLFDTMYESCQCPSGYSWSYDYVTSNYVCKLYRYGNLWSGDNLPAAPYGFLFNYPSVLVFTEYGVLVYDYYGSGSNYYFVEMVNASALGVVPGELLMNVNGEIQLISTTGEVYSNTSFPAGSHVELTNLGNVIVRDSSWNVVYQTGKVVSCPYQTHYSAADSTCMCHDIFVFDALSESCQCPSGYSETYDYSSGSTVCSLNRDEYLWSGDNLPAVPHGFLTNYPSALIFNEYGVLVYSYWSSNFYFVEMVNASAMGVSPGELLMNVNGEIQLISTTGEVYSNTSFPAGSHVELTNLGNVIVRDSSWNVVYQTGKVVSCPYPAQYSDNGCMCPALSEFNPLNGICECLGDSKFDFWSQRCKCPGNMPFNPSTQTCGCPDLQVFDESSQSCQCPPGYVWIDNIAYTGYPFCSMPIYETLQSGQSMSTWPRSHIVHGNAVEIYDSLGFQVVQYGTACGSTYPCPSYYVPYMVNATALGLEPGKVSWSTTGSLEMISTSGEVYQSWEFSPGSYSQLTRLGNVFIRAASGEVEYQSGKFVACPPGATLTSDYQCVCPTGSSFHRRSEMCECSPGLHYTQVDGQGAYGCAAWVYIP